MAQQLAAGGDQVLTVGATLAQNLGLSPRPDGTQQLTFKNQPLYHYVGDSQPGDTNGQGSGGVWFVVDAPTAAAATSTAAPSY
ncbi:MAG: hypothetical protein JOY61_25745 [Chloroflexi bacterium]|nr:hypothetical protein [Chloroflexota bacterium]